jgi:hypothetical protein
MKPTHYRSCAGIVDGLDLQRDQREATRSVIALQIGPSFIRAMHDWTTLRL